MTLSLKEAALAAEQDTARATRDKRAAERQKHLTELVDQWDTRATLTYKGEPLPNPEPDAFTWNGYPGFTFAGYARQESVYGWSWETDGITFLYDATYSGQGLCVILTCPDCGERHAAHPHGLDGLGKLVRLGRSTSHKCREVATRHLAYAIREAAQTTGLTPHDIAALAADREEAWPR